MFRIVIADDNAYFRAALSHTLSGFDVVGEAENGEEAIEVVQSKRPDLLILDLSMPKMSGLAVIEKIRHTIPDQKILVLTIHELEDYWQKALKAGADGYCLKDETTQQILAAVNKTLQT